MNLKCSGHKPLVNNLKNEHFKLDYCWSDLQLQYPELQEFVLILGVLKLLLQPAGITLCPLRLHMRKRKRKRWTERERTLLPKGRTNNVCGVNVSTADPTIN